MGDCVERSDREKRSRESAFRNQSVWLTHWNAGVQESNAFGNSVKIYDGKNHHPTSQTEFALNVFRSPKQSGETETRRFEIMNESGRARNLRNEASACRSGQRSSIPWIGRDIETGKVNPISTSTSCIPFATATEISSREFHSRKGSKFGEPMEQVKTHAFFRESGFVESKPFPGTSPGSASDIVPYRSGDGSIRLESERRAISSFMEPCSNRKLSETNDSHFMLGRQSSNNHKHCENLFTPYFKQNITTLLSNDSSTSDPPEFGGEHLKLPNFSGLRQLQLPHQCHTAETLNHGYYSLEKLPNSVHDVETMRMCTNVDSVVGSSTGYPRFSQTTRSLFITKKTDVNSKGKEVLKDFGNAYLNLQTPSPFFNYGQHRVKIHSLDSSADSEGKENTEVNNASKAILKNESSAETDTMDMDAFMEKKHVSAVNASPLNKELSPLIHLEAIEKDPKPSKLPDMNIEFCDLSPDGNTRDVAEPSSSKTQSLDTDLLLGHPEPINHENSRKPDSSERWIKRLKLSTSDSLGLGMQISNLEDFSHKKAAISGLKEENSHGEGLTKLDKTTTFLRNREFLSVGTGKKGEDLLLSQSWIQRWLHNNQGGNTPKETEAVVLCEPESSKLASDDFQEKRFPSIAAMALMGKAMNGFQPCQIEKRGSFVFWNTKEV